MKTVAVMQLELLRELTANTDVHAAMLITTDEEIGGQQGAAKFVRDLKYRPHVVLMPDGGRNWHLVLEEKGVLWLDVIVNGEASHGSRPWTGINACHVWDDYLSACKKYLRAATRQKQRGVSINVGSISGGQAYNQVCPEVTVNVDVRFPAHQNADSILEKLQSVARRSPYKGRVMIKEIVRREPASTKPSNGAMRLFSKIVKEELQPKTLNTEYSCGSSDAQWFTNENIPVLIMFPEGDGHHSEHEWVSLESVETLRNIYRRFCIEFSAQL